MRAFRQLGIEAGIAYAWSRSSMGGAAIAQSPIMRTTVTAERLAKRGYQSFTKYYEQIKNRLVRIRRSYAEAPA